MNKLEPCLHYARITKHSNHNLIDRHQFPWLTVSMSCLCKEPFIILPGKGFLHKFAKRSVKEYGIEVIERGQLLFQFESLLAVELVAFVKRSKVALN